MEKDVENVSLQNWSLINDYAITTQEKLHSTIYNSASIRVLLLEIQ